MKELRKGLGRVRERGATLVLVAVSLISLLGVMALAVDLGMLYVARNDAQRAADAAALAGAKSLADSNCWATDSCAAQGTQEGPARQQAETVGAQNLVLGQAASISDSDIGFSYPSGNEPQITVTVQRSSIPLIFGRVLGQFLSTVSAKATAEAIYSEQGCLVPFIVPNCDQTNTATPPAGAVQNDRCYSFNGNNSAPSLYTGYKLISTGDSSDTIAAGKAYTWAIGQTWTLHYNSNTSSVPSQFYMVDFGNNNSSAAIKSEILGCYTGTVITPGDAASDLLTTTTGNMADVVGAVEQRIYASGDGLGKGQDSIISPLLSTATGNWDVFGTFTDEALSTAYTSVGVTANTQTGSPLDIEVGSGNPLAQTLGSGATYTQSPSIVTVPVYDYVNTTCAGSGVGSCTSSGTAATDAAAPGQTTALSPGGSQQAVVIGYLQMFIVDAYLNGTDKVIDVVITGIGGATPQPDYAQNGPLIRLIQNPT